MGNNHRMTTIVFEDLALLNSESVLFIYHDESEFCEFNRILYQSMCPEYDIRLSESESGASILLDTRREGSDQEICLDSPLHEPIFLSSKMLTSQYLGRCHDRDLDSFSIPIHLSAHEDRMDTREECHHCLPCSDITLQHPCHRMRTFHIFENLEQYDSLLVRERKWE